jgi:hypothetical protein
MDFDMTRQGEEIKLNSIRHIPPELHRSDVWYTNKFLNTIAYS